MGDRPPSTTRSKMHDALPLSTVSRLTGLSADVIRAWEKRYGVVRPKRGPRGARLYDADDVAHLRLLARVVAAGRAIGDVARLGRAELDALDARTPIPHETIRRGTAEPSPDGIVGRTLDAVRRFDAAELDRRLAEALLALGCSDFVRQVARPLLEEVGDRWRDGHLSVADEHLVSGLLRSLLTGLYRTRRVARPAAVLLATPAGERHELGLLLTATLLADRGLAISYLGPDLPAAEIATASRRAGVGVVGLGVVNGENRSTAANEIRALERLLEPHVELWIGGREAGAVRSTLPQSRALVVDSLERLDLEIDRLVARTAGVP